VADTWSEIEQNSKFDSEMWLIEDTVVKQYETSIQVRGNRALTFLLVFGVIVLGRLEKALEEDTQENSSNAKEVYWNVTLM